MKHSGYIPWGPSTWSVVSRITLSSNLLSGTLNVLQVPQSRTGVLDTLLILLECWHFTHRLGIKCQEQLWGQEWPMSSMSLIRNPQYSWWWCGHPWHTSNHARMLTFFTQFGHPNSRTIIRSRMTHVLHVLHVSSQEFSMSSKSLMRTGWFLTHF